MKLDQISEGNWVSKSLDGVEKRFKTSDTAGRDAWSQSYAKPQKPAAAPAPKQQGIDLDTVWRKVEQVVGNIFPDGDPIDWLAPWLEKQGVRDFKIGEILDQAAQKNGYNDIYDYYEQMKQQYGADMGALEEGVNEVPEIGDTVRTKKMQMTGKVEKIEPHQGYLAVLFRTEDGRLMRAPVDNVTVVEKLADQNMSEGFPYDVDHMPGRVVKTDMTNQTVRYFYNEWKELADRANAEQHDNNLLISSGPESVLYQEDDGTIYAKWDKKKKVGFVKGKTTEGSMGGINRSAPAQDVSYEKVLDEVMGMWQEAQLQELSVDTMQKYRKAVTSPAAVRTRPLRKLAKSVVGFKQAGDKIDARTGDRSGNKPKSGPINSRHHGATYEERLAEFLDVEEDLKTDFSDILGKQHKDDQEQIQKKRKVVPIDYHGWTIKYRDIGQPGDVVDWVIYDKKGNTVKQGEASSGKEAVQQAQDFINQGGGTKQQASTNVTIDFNVDFAREFAPGGETLYIMFDKAGNAPMIYVSSEAQNGFKRTHIRNQKHKMTATTTGLPMVSLTANEANSLGLQPNGRYLLGDKDPIDDNTAAFPLIFQGIVQGKGDMVRMGKPGLTVAHNRDVDEEYQGPWQGDPVKYAKAPKSSTYGKGGVRLSDLVKDSIDTHGVKWAFDYYVKKHGMPPRHFKIYAGL